MTELFLTGMLRSGTSLIQTLLTNHPQLFVAYQPYYQFYVECKQQFLETHALRRFLPLGDALEDTAEVRSLFDNWLRTHVFSEEDAAALVASATQGKGGAAPEMQGRLPGGKGTFFDLHAKIHRALAERYKPEAAFVGAKEVLCEEFLPTLVAAGFPCILIVRDPRAVIASASFGRYRDRVGDRYPLLMLIRLWRKSAAYWLAYRRHPLVHVLRYEDLVVDADRVLEEIRLWLDLSAFPAGLISQTLRDHQGEFWKGNSSFEDKMGVQASAEPRWKQLLRPEEIAFIEACTMPEMRALGYMPASVPSRNSIAGFVEDTRQVRPTYLEYYKLNPGNRALELQRWESAALGNYDNPPQAPGLFLFPTVLHKEADASSSLEPVGV